MKDLETAEELLTKARADFIAKWEGVFLRGEPESWQPDTHQAEVAALLRIPAQKIQGTAEPGLVSCLMITQRPRLQLARQAIACFEKQSYGPRELVVCSDDESVSEIATGDGIRFVLAPSGLCLGELRNFSIGRSRGEYVAQWDDDDWYHPDRLLRQIEKLAMNQDCDACVLERWTMIWPERNLYMISSRRAWEGSLVARRWRMPCYPALVRGEDVVPVLAMRLCKLDEPDLYVYRVHGGNTWDEFHFESMFRWSADALDQNQISELKQKLSIP